MKSYQYKGYDVNPYTGQVYHHGKLKQPTKCGRKNEYLKISIGSESSATVQRVIVCAYYDIESLSGYYVHHIDYNPHNNTITNLLVVDRQLHNMIHKLDQTDYYITCRQLKKEERARLKEWRLLK